MIDYITLGTRNLDRARPFYDAVMAALGLHRLVTTAEEIGYGQNDGDPARSTLWIVTPYDGREATAGNGTMVALAAPTRAAVDAFHAAGMAHSGSDEGKPGLRPYGENFYACYIRDPDGNKLSAVCRRAE
ncbi:MAG: VOC family protein [Rhodobacteraceae bacterium]|nr:VOC family protein [Paracoccaceae bacterium]